MHTSYAPEKIDEDYLENLCEDLRCELISVLDNEGGSYRAELADNVTGQLKHIAATLDAMMVDG